MIDKSVFASELEILMDWFNRDFEQKTIDRLHQRLSQSLTTKEFQTAANQLFDTAKFFPNVEDFINVIKGFKEAHALEAWEKCRSAAARADWTMGDRLSPQGKFALRAIGGIGRLAQMEESDHKWARKEFVGAWMAWTPPVGTLPEAFVGDATAATSEQSDASAYSPPPAHVVEKMRELFEKVSANRNGKHS